MIGLHERLSERVYLGVGVDDTDVSRRQSKLHVQIESGRSQRAGRNGEIFCIN